MNPDTIKQIGKYAGGLIAIGIGVAGLLNPPLLTIDRAFDGALIAAGFSALGFDAGSIIATPIGKVAASLPGAKPKA